MVMHDICHERELFVMQKSLNVTQHSLIMDA